MRSLCTPINTSGLRERRLMPEKTVPLSLSLEHCLCSNWLTTHRFIHTHTPTHKGLGTWVSASVLMNLSPGGGAGLMFHTKSPRWATEPTRGQQINLHYISIPTIHLMRGDYMRESVCRLSWYCITNEIRVSFLLIQIFMSIVVLGPETSS